MASILWLKFKRMRTEVMMYVIMMVMAIVLSFVFGTAIFGGNNIPRVYISDNDHSEATESFVQNIDSNAYTIEFCTALEAEILVAKGEALAAIVIPKGFGESLKNGNAGITMLKTADNTDIMALENAISTAAGKTAHIYALHGALANTLANVDITAPSLDDVREQHIDRMGENAIVKVTMNVVGTDEYDDTFAGNVHFMMGFNIFFVLFSIVFTIGSILEDKKLNTWDRMKISPLSGTAILAGNFIPTFLVGVAQMGIVLFAAQFLFGVDFGASLAPIFLVFVVFALTSTCLGLLLSTLFNTYEQLNAATPVIIVSTSMLGGCMWPLNIVGSDFLVKLANVMPQKWALEATESLAVFGGGIGSVLTNIFVLLGMALVFFVVSVVLYNKKRRV